MKLLLLSAAMAVLAVSGNCLAEEPAKVDPALNGRWMAVSVEGTGIKMTRKQLQVMQPSFVFDNGKLTAERGGETRTGTYTTDQSKDPKQLDLVLNFNNGQAKPLEAIYKIDKDTLILCHRDAGGPRPDEFAKTGRYFISTYEREAK